MASNTQEQFIQKAVAVHGDLYDYSLVDYVRSNIKVTIICKIHGPFEQQPNNHVNSKQGCPVCSKSKQGPTKWTNPEAIGKLVEVHGVLYDYSLVEYTNHTTKISIICSTHGTFQQRFGDHLGGSHCPICATATRKHTMVRKHGVEHPLQSPIIQEKRKSTMVDRYKVEHSSQSPIIRAKKKSTNLAKYGTEFHKQKHMLNILPLLTDTEWLIDQYVNQNKTAIQIADEVGIGRTAMLQYLRKSEIEIRTNFFVSYKQMQWLNSLQISHLIHEWAIPGTRYKSDGYDPETNTIYEFHGDYWHGNPAVFNSDVYNNSTNCCMGELLRRTKAREQLVLAMGYNLVVMWESDWVE
jgi:hypothetical protein